MAGTTGTGGKAATPAPLPSTTSLSKAELLALARAYVEKGGEGVLAPDFMYVCMYTVVVCLSLFVW